MMKLALRSSGASCVALLGCALILTACEPEKKKTAATNTAATQTTQAETKSAKNTTATPSQTSQTAGKPMSPEELVKESRKYGHIPIVGDTTREQVIEKFPNWKKAEGEAKADEGVGAKLAAVPPGATVTIVFGTWCSDCYRELPRLWDALDQVSGKEPPFTIKYLAVNENLLADRDLTKLNIHNIPTFIVERDGKEVGRIIESAPAGIETDLLGLLDGSQKGIVSNSPTVRTQYGLGAKK